MSLKQYMNLEMMLHNLEMNQPCWKQCRFGHRKELSASTEIYSHAQICTEHD